MKHDNKTALVTGASRGIGAAVARQLAADGFSIVVNYATEQDAAEAVVAEITDAGGTANSCQADVSSMADVVRLFEHTQRTIGLPTVLVNAAGVMQLASIAESDTELFDKVVNVNFRGTFNMLHQAASCMPEGGRIINFSSSVVELKFPGYALYAASKAAVETMSAILSKEMRGRRITVNTVAPGPTATALFLDGKTDEQVRQLSSLSPLERLAEPQDIANAVSFLAGPQGGWINGQTLRANGGVI